MTNVVSIKGEEPEHYLVIVHWKDIMATAGWEEGDDVDPPNFQTIGWLHSSSDDTIKVGNTIGEDEKPYGITAFPIGCVEKIERLAYDP